MERGRAAGPMRICTAWVMHPSNAGCIKVRRPSDEHSGRSTVNQSWAGAAHTQPKAKAGRASRAAAGGCQPGLIHIDQLAVRAHGMHRSTQQSERSRSSSVRGPSLFRPSFPARSAPFLSLPLMQHGRHISAVPLLGCCVQQEAGPEAVGRQGCQLGGVQARHSSEVSVVGTDVAAKEGLQPRGSERIVTVWAAGEHTGSCPVGMEEHRKQQLRRPLEQAPSTATLVLPTGSSLLTVTGTCVSHTSCRSLASRQPAYTCGPVASSGVG